ncbi:MAG: right-handed parallel beta-helix repeat-containing protein, partial [Kiritimatiellales bacterium]
SGEKVNLGALTLTNFFVSPQGSDQWTGRIAEPNADNSDGPLATLSGAQEAIRALKSKGALPGPVTVTFRGGIYPVQTTLQFTATDSGTKAAPVTYQAQKGEEVVISGGKKVFGWKEVAGGLLETEIPGVKEGRLYFNELYIGGNRAMRTRLPKKGFYRINHLVKDSEKEFYFNLGDIQNWTNLRDVNVTCYHSWTASLQWIDSVDLNENKVVFQNPAGYKYKLEQYGGKPPRFYVENVREALTEPGEWYLDRKTGILTYFPKSGETPDNLKAWYPVVDRILNFAGEPKNGSFVEWLSFKDLSFRHSDWGIVPGPTTVVDGQAHVRTRNAMVFARGLRNSRFENCEFSEGGVHAIWLEQGSSDNSVVRCHLRDFGGGGVYIGDTGYSNDEKIRSDRNTVDNCFIHNLNHRLHGAVGVWIGRSSFNRITHNEISDLDYSPISAGWVWGYKTPSGVEGNLFEYNHLHHYGLGELSDMGGIYTLGISPGTVARFNIIHDGCAYAYGGFGLYTDEGSSDILLEKNLVYNTRSGSFNQNYGSNNLIRNNIFAFAAEQNIVNNRAGSENKSFRFEKNIVLTKNGFPVNGAFMSNAFKFEENLYWDLNNDSLTNMSFSGWTWDEWREKGYDQTSFILNPGFVDPLRADFRLKSETAVQKIGFVPFDEELAKTGLYGDRAWKDLPKKYTPRPVSADILPPAAKRIAGSRKLFAEDFEALAPGAPSPFGQSDPAILVSAEEAFKGEHSLKFQDDPSYAGDISPYLMFKYDLDPGTIHASMDVFLEEGAIFRHDWRGPGNTDYKIGPSFRFEANGDVTVLGKIISSVPRRKWIHVEMLFENGLKSGTWDLALTVDGEARKTFDGLRCGSRDFESLQTLIWSSMARTKTAFYLDNVHFEVEK